MRVAVSGFAEDIKLEELRLQFETNFFGVVAMTKAALPTMRQQRSGHIIQVSSISGLHGVVTVSSCAASKHALEVWSESLRMEVSSLGIKVVLVEPGAFQTDIWTRGAVMGDDVKKQTSPKPSTKLVACESLSRKSRRLIRSQWLERLLQLHRIPIPGCVIWWDATPRSSQQ
jgi:short-subunit dehydrogenase